MARNATDLMAQYAAYHRDRRNIATHFVGIPLIVYAIAILLARPVVELGALPFTPIHAVWLLSTLWYLTRGEFALVLHPQPDARPPDAGHALLALLLEELPLKTAVRIAAQASGAPRNALYEAALALRSGGLGT